MRPPMILWGQILLFWLVVTAAAGAQGFPDRPVTIVHGFGAGGGADLLLRAIIPAVSDQLGQPLVVDYRVGAGGNIAISYVARAAPDGYTLLLGTPGFVWNPLIFAEARFDPLHDFAPVGLIGSVPTVLVVNPALPAHSVAELVALARARPGKLTFASSGVGSSLQLTGELFKLAAGIDLTHVPYKGSLQAEADIMSGQVDMMFNVLPSALPLIQGGQLRPLAVTASTRAATLPETPTMIEAGLPGFVALTWNGILAPAATPTPVIDRLSTAFRQALERADVIARLVAMGQDPMTSTPAAFGAFLRQEHDKWAHVIATSGIQAQ
jgi:tripartite-type tricarboxylate transporter receptor subunit TctC